MNKNIRDILFCLICVGSAFRLVPILYYSKFLIIIGGGGGFGTKLMFAPLLLGILYTLYCYLIKKDRNALVFSKKIVLFGVLYLALTYISLAWGIMNFPFWDQVANDANDFGQIGKVQGIFYLFGINPTHETLITIMLLLRTIKNSLFQFIWSFGGVYLIYCWYRNDHKRLLNLVTIAISILVFIEIFNSFFEWLYLAGNDWGKYILEKMTPYFHPVNLPDKPVSSRLLWRGQLRGTFTEPSYFGMFCAFSLPFLWYNFVSQKDVRISVFYGVLSLIMAFNIFLTSSRAAVGLYLGELLLLVGLGILIHTKKILVMIGFVIAINCMGLGMGSIFMNHIMAPDMQQIAAFGMNDSGYMERNLESLSDINKRSNRSRYTIVMAHIRIGLNHPILGVGYGLRNPYVGKYLEGQTLNPELKRWQDVYKREGILIGSFPNLGDYWVHFAERGILGLIAYLTIPIILLIKLAKAVFHKKSLSYGIVMISLIGCLGIGLDDSITVLYVYWLIMGIGYALTANLNKHGISH